MKNIYEDINYINKIDSSIGKLKFHNLIKYIINDFKKDDIVLEVGCGTCNAFEFIHNRIDKYYGIDISENFIKYSENKFKNYEKKPILKKIDIITFCNETNIKFDKILAIDFVEHITDQEFLDYFSNLKKILKSKGSIYIHTPNGEYFLEILKSKNILKQLDGHIAIRKPSDYINLFKSCGFDNINIRLISHYNIMKYFHFLSYIPIIGKFFKARILIKIVND